ncbi:hypothetical protein F5883DRAFT_231688 [Diaporthe sp. PMI_573]|nr:hypothetical protein F5883DRAFT_231688 [Diaporthaceae sp. PMI_573]
MGFRRNHGLSFLVAIDGGGVSSVTIHQHHISKLLRGIHDGKTKTLRKFRFAPVSIVDDANNERISIDTKVAQDLGLIRVCVRRAIIKEKPVRKARSRFGLEYDTDGLSLPEKALKGRVISHGTALSAPVRCVMKSALRLRYMGSEDSPLGIFHFKYRSKEALQQELIIARPRTPSVDYDVENLPLDEIRRLALERLLQIKDGKNRAVSIKDENDGKVAKLDKSLKYISIKGGKMAIDLTGDD